MNYLKLLILFFVFPFYSLAATYYDRPDVPISGAEFGDTIAKHGKYIVVGSLRHAEFGRGGFNPNDMTTNINYDNGAVYLITDDGSEPVRKYQFLKDPTLNWLTYQNYLGTPMNFGAQVDISEDWIIATMNRHYFPGDGVFPAVVLIKKENGVFPTCPKSPYWTGTKQWKGKELNSNNQIIEVNNITNCSGHIQPVKLPLEYQEKLTKNDSIIKVSGNYFAIATATKVSLWKKVSANSDWQLDYTSEVGPGFSIISMDISDSSLVYGVRNSSGTNVLDSENNVISSSPNYVAYSHIFNGQRLSYTQNSPNNMAGFGSSVVFVDGKVLVGAGAESYPGYPSQEHLDLFPVPPGYIFQYAFRQTSSNSGLFSLLPEYKVLSSMPKRIVSDGRTFGVALSERNKTGLNISDKNFSFIQPNTVVKFYRDSTHFKNIASVSVSDFQEASPSYTVTQFAGEHPFAISNGKYVYGWKGATGHNQADDFTVTASGAFFIGNIQGAMPVSGKNYYIESAAPNHSKKGLHGEYGSLELGAILPGWHSAQWQFEIDSSGYVKIRNRHYPSRYLHVTLSYPPMSAPIAAIYWGDLPPDPNDAKWVLEPVNSDAPGLKYAFTIRHLGTSVSLNAALNGYLSRGEGSGSYWYIRAVD